MTAWIANEKSPHSATNLATAGSSEPPPESQENSKFMREKYDPVQVSVAGKLLVFFLSSFSPLI